MIVLMLCIPVACKKSKNPAAPAAPPAPPTNTFTSTHSPTPTSIGWCGGTFATCTPTQTGWCGGVFATCTPTNTATNTRTSTDTPTETRTFTLTSTPTDTATPTHTPTNVGWCGGAIGTCTPTNVGWCGAVFATCTPTDTVTSTHTRTHTWTFTWTFTRTPTRTHTVTSTPTDTPTLSPTDTMTPTVTNTGECGGAPGTCTFTGTPTHTYTYTRTRTATYSPTPTFTYTPIPPATSTPTQTWTATFFITPSGCLPENAAGIGGAVPEGGNFVGQVNISCTDAVNFVTLSAAFSHTCPSEIELTLTSPQGTQVFMGIGGSDCDPECPADGPVLGSSVNYSTFSFQYENPSGAWTLTAGDQSPCGDWGNITSWSLSVSP